MSALAFAARPQPEPRTPQLFAVEGGGQGPETAQAVTPVTLAAVASHSWAALAAGARADCLMCGAALEARWSAGQGVVGGRCRSCGSTLD